MGYFIHTMNKCIFLDRDGTLIEDKEFLNDPNNIVYIDGVFEGLKQLKQQGFKFVVVTNQSGVAKGIVDEKNVEEIHLKMKDNFNENDITFLDWLSAPYLSTSNHYYRKPNPGMLIEAALIYDLDLSQSWIIGDKLSDAEAGKNAGCKAVLIENQQYETKGPYPTQNNFSDCVKYILENS